MFFLSTNICGAFSSFYNVGSFDISHSYFNRNLIKKPSFPYLPSHFNYLKNNIDNNNKEQTYIIG